MTPRELLEQLNELDEHTRVEAKAASEIGKSALETIYYLPTEKLLAPWQARATASGLQSENLSGQPVELSGQSIQVSSKPVELPGKPVELTLQVSDLPAPLAEVVNHLPKKMQKIEVRHLIVRLCRWRPLSSAELSQLLRRNQTYLLNEFLAVMVTEGQLELTIPDQPNHPQQRYRAAILPEEHR